MPATMNDTSSVRPGAMPINLAASRLLETARKARPYQLRDSHHHKPPISTKLTTKKINSLRMLYNGPTTKASCNQLELVERTSAFQISRIRLVRITPMPKVSISELISRSFFMRLTIQYTPADVALTTTSAIGIAHAGLRPSPDSTE